MSATLQRDQAGALAKSHPRQALALTESARENIGNQGYDPVYGARPLKRAIQHHLLDQLSLEILDGKFKNGDVITADFRDGAMRFEA